MKNKLKLHGRSFKIKRSGETNFYIFDSDEQEGTITISFDIEFKGRYKCEKVMPTIRINEHQTGVKSIHELVGREFAVDSLEECDEREDIFYVYEHEPMENYRFTILEIKEQELHIKGQGVAIVDGYAEPYKTAKFKIDCWLPMVL